MELRSHILPLILGAIGLIFIILGLIQLNGTKNESESNLTFEAGKNKEEAKDLMVDVEGAILSPGIYTLASGSRMVDALAASGGLSEDANRYWVEKNINLASILTDGLKIYIPRQGEEVLAEGSSSSNGPVININTASSTDLEALPGIGEVTAQKIIEARPFSKVDDLLTKKILGSKVYEEIKAKLTAY